MKINGMYFPVINGGGHESALLGERLGNMANCSEWEHARITEAKSGSPLYGELIYEGESPVCHGYYCTPYVPLEKVGITPAGVGYKPWI